ncbi:hypothetical protein [Staphylococcus phage SA3]|uniref:Uncharacterized protein n=4 Tax=Kayvirus P108 TaxID=1924731 RepID=A0A7G7WVE5_9CAUD|nr:hypothetical protein [Staphylococcus phage SA3]AUG85675.1 hypothetical protein HSA30_gp171 [Staphylococcus phage HSA30]QEQ93159.1 hypothetical protein [Staphylococcus phage vB_SauH_IME522]QKV30573.1 hypothetical protein [Staphylococcus phage ESa1]QNH71189.1 hypothetical protein StAP1_057 [Staphylococcus phage vB_SauH_SAP1]QZQ74995.1 hypothetical protein [Staphylococcus phage vB_ScoM-PSC1]UVD37172.1 hypothetical protein [Staphylococcus phage SYL]WBF81495.1 hypothetical protein [Staphylococ
MIFKNNKVEKEIKKDINFIRICDVSGSSIIVQQKDTKTNLNSFIEGLVFNGAKTLESNKGDKSLWFKDNITHIDTVYYKEVEDE